MNKDKIKLIVFCLLGIVLAFTVNYVVTLFFVLPNAFKYSIGDSNWLIELLYTFSASDGYEPFPSGINITLTIVLGIVAGLFMAKQNKKRGYA